MFSMVATTLKFSDGLEAVNEPMSATTIVSETVLVNLLRNSMRTEVRSVMGIVLGNKLIYNQSNEASTGSQPT